jgi:hypothetical protein
MVTTWHPRRDRHEAGASPYPTVSVDAQSSTGRSVCPDQVPEGPIDEQAGSRSLVLLEALSSCECLARPQPPLSFPNSLTHNYHRQPPTFERIPLPKPRHNS